MNTEWEVKNILRMGVSREKRAELIMKFASYREEDIIKALKKGGKNVSDVYRTLVNLNKKLK